MAKIDIPNISSPYASQNALNVRFKMIEDALNDKVLWRDNPVGEVNTLKNDIDLGNNDLINVGVLSASSIMVQGKGLDEGITEAVARCIEEADKAEDARVGAEQAQAAAESAATTAAYDAVAAADSLLSSYVSSAEGSKNAAAQSAAEAEASANAASASAATAASDAAVASAAASTATTASSLSSGYATSAEAAKTAAEQARAAAEAAEANAAISASSASAAADTASTTVADATSLLSGYVTSAEQAKTAAETAAGNAEASAIRAESAAEQAQLPTISVGDEGKVLTVSPSLEPEWAAPPIESVNIAPQTIVRAPVGSRPTGWTAADCDAPVQSLYTQSSLVRVAAGLQVAYADNGIVKLSEVLGSTYSVNLSSAATGVYYIYANIAEDGKFIGFGYTDNQPMVGTERSGAGDLYNPATVTMYDTNDNPIRRVYLGRIGKSGSVLTIHTCYSLGTSATIPLMDSNAQPLSTYVKFLGFLMANGSCRVEFYASPYWFEAPAMVSGSTSFGVFDRVLTPVTFRFKTGDNLGSHPETASPITQAKARLVIQRGY